MLFRRSSIDWYYNWTSSKIKRFNLIINIKILIYFKNCTLKHFINNVKNFAQPNVLRLVLTCI